MLDYTAEAAVYDRTRGGVPRAEAAAAAVRGLLPADARRLLDLACGTGIVTERLGRPGLQVMGVDAAFGMAARAAERLPGRVVLGDGTRLPFAAGAFDAVSAVWLLHLLPDVEPVLAECARVLRPGGVLLATVDKDAGHNVGSDIDAVFAPYLRPHASDEFELVCAAAGRHGLRTVAETVFPGHGQGRSPRTVAAALRAGRYVSRVAAVGPDLEALAGAVESLPDPDGPRPEPRFRLVALQRF
ncbi:class I SAM-dependent methyltransferase [Streptomyces sp. TRM66268-LWL]|uniref:Class I SAM-dependent methyltransferase n=1 Tax=Streptomyces polyasparticus TaxID=2767826 RepID=A0ABR7SD60_9ACTN|nr:class I SAM-dependent methyltransferase [Streptomyces polyasparticus]MBC9713421.1 class I SAM-dependent methyltransferase [Streptomyces polyasparticus]